MLNDSWELNAPANDEDGEPGGRKKRLLKKSPDAPKRFKTAYICFVMVMMDGVKEESPKNEKVSLNFIRGYFFFFHGNKQAVAAILN